MILCFSQPRGTMWRHFSSRTRRLSLFSLHSSSSSTAACPFIVRSSHFSPFSTYSSYSPSLSRRLEEESRNVRVRVWWEFDTCKLPTEVNVLKVAPMITAALKANGIKGPIEICAFGNILKLSGENQGATCGTGIDFRHLPERRRCQLFSTIFHDIENWAEENPPPAHLFLISGDGSYASLLHRKRMENYNILVATTGGAMDCLSLCSASTIAWDWNLLVRGKKFIGNRCNFPPDGFNDSWYGHFEAPLEDAFSSSKEPTSLYTGYAEVVLKAMCSPL